MIDFKKQIKISTRAGLIILAIILSPYIVFLFIGGLNTNETSQTNNYQTPATNEGTANEYGSSLAECLQKADSWFIEAKQTTNNVLAEEKTRKNLYQGFIDQNASSESEIMASLQVELIDYKKECDKRF